MTTPIGPATAAAHELARVAAQAADGKKGLDTLILDVGNVLAITEAFVVTSAGNRRQVRTIADAVEEEAKILLERAPLRVEGLADLQWVLLDYGDVVVHVFADETRRFYEIERLYRDAPRIEWTPAPSD
jgi:ribosome-associated protein